MALVPFNARGDIYETAFFSGQLNAVTGSLSEIGLTGSNVMSGNFVFDPQMIPPAGSGTQSVSFSSMPVITAIPNSTSFLMNLDEITPNLSNFLPGTGAIQYVNGSFDGFDLEFDFVSGGNEYEFIENGSWFEIELLENYQPTGDIVVCGTINFGPYSPITQPPCDELSALSNLGNGIGGLGSGGGGGGGLGLGGGGGNGSGGGLGSGSGGNGSRSSGGGSKSSSGSSGSGKGHPVSVNSVPEPRMFWLFFVALIALAARARLRAVQ
jgi:hypothetical protein